MMPVGTDEFTGQSAQFFNNGSVVLYYIDAVRVIVVVRVIDVDLTDEADHIIAVVLLDDADCIRESA